MGNSSFAAIEPDYLNGKTDDKNARHLPFKDANGNSTVNFSGQTERLDQLTELAAYAKAGKSNSVSVTRTALPP